MTRGEGGLGKKLLSMTREKVILYDKGDLGVRLKVFFVPHKELQVCFKSYFKPLWSLLNWFSNKSQRNFR